MVAGRSVRKLHFEVTSFCNFACPFCPMRVSRRPPRHAALSLFTRTLDEVVENGITDTIGFHVLGEPLLYPHLLEVVAGAAARGLRTELTTNGSLVTEETVRRLAGAGLDELHVSLQVFGAAEHALRRAPYSYETYYRGILDSVRLVERLGGPLQVALRVMNAWTLGFYAVDRTVGVRWDRADFRRRMTRLCQDLCAATGRSASAEAVGAAAARLNPYRAQDVRISGKVRIMVRPFLDWGNAFAERPLHPSRFGYCGLAFTTLGVLSGGDVVLCCADYDGGTSLGNLNEQSLPAILSSDRARGIAEGFRRFRVVEPHCQRCLGGTSRLKTLLRALAGACVFKARELRLARGPREVPLFAPSR